MSTRAPRRPHPVACWLLVVAACRASPSTGAPAGDIAWQPPIELATGGGTKGAWQQNASRYDYVDDPSVAVLADGATITTWVDHRDRDVHVQVLDADGAARGARVNVSRTPAVFSWLPRLALSPAHPRDVYVIWQEIVFSGGTHGGEIFVARSTDGGASFQVPRNLSRSTAGDGKGRVDARTWHNGSLDLAVGPDGTLYAAWTAYDGPLWIARSTDRGASFSEPQRIAGTATEPARAPALAIDAGGRVYLAWTVGERADADIRVAVADPPRRTAVPAVATRARRARRDPRPRAGPAEARRHATATRPRAGDAADDAHARRTPTVALRFGPPVIVAATPTYSDAPKLALDRAGTLHVAFAETTGGPFDRSTIRYARSRDRGRTFEPARTLSRGEGSASFPAIAVDARDRVVVVWEAAVIADERPRGLAITTSHDGGRTFATPAPIPGSRDPRGGWNGSHQGHLMRKLALRDDTIVVGNSALAPGVSSRVWIIRGRLRTPG